jgi:hypothetical protein
MTEATYECQDDCPLKDSYGNCYHRGDDGEVVQCVDDWAEEKYYYLERYLIAFSDRCQTLRFAQGDNF